MSNPSGPNPSGPASPRPPVRARARRAWLFGGVGALLLLGVAWAGSTLYAAGQAGSVTDDFSRTLDQTLRANKLGSVEKHVYSRGLTNSTDDLYVVLNNQSTPYRLHLRNHIQHGPLPGFSRLAQAVVDTEIVWDSSTQAALDKAFGGKKPVIRTVVQFGGGTDTTLQLPAGQFADSSVKGSWTALDGHFTSSDGGRGLSGALTWPSGTLGPAGGDASQGVLKISDVRYTVQQQPYLRALSQGKSSFNIASIELPAGLGNLRGLELSTVTAPDGATLSSTTQARVNELNYAGSRFTQLLLRLSARSLNSAALEDLVAVFQRPEYQKLTQGGSAPSDQTLQKLWSDVKPGVGKLLAGNPALSVDELSAQTPDGPLRLSMSAQVVDGKSINLDSFTGGSSAQTNQQAMALLGNLKLTADIQGKQSVIAGLLSSSGNPAAENIAQSIDPLVQQGIIVRSGDTLRTHLEFGKGGATINGKPVPQQ